ncbi:MAG: hypothetical protein HYT27_02590 [Parcubacteria group bacterium]|nr:hypothetical protein [Parcubacteria group bacterium]
MIGILLVLAATFFEEISDSIGKHAVSEKKESLYTFGFLALLWGTVFLLLSAFIRDAFVFSFASIPTLGVRVILEIVQIHVTLLAITIADRSTFGFLRITTIPLLLVVDILLDYSIGIYGLWGIGLIVLALIVLFINHGITKKGAGLVLFAAVNAVATISLYKYNITHFNSVEVEQGIVHIALLIYAFTMATLVAKENPIRFLKNPLFLGQSFASGIGTVFISFAYLFGAASVITTVKRAAAILWAMLSGNVYFKEKRFLIKAFSLILIIVGLVFLAL